MIWCQSCKTVIWAYDHQVNVDLRGIANMWKLPCPKCGVTGNFDGWGKDNKNFAKASKELFDLGEKPYDWWSIMRIIAKQEKVEWEPSGDNSWFARPRYDNKQYDHLMKAISGLVVKESGYHV